MELKRFVAFITLMWTTAVLRTLDRLLAALYFHGAWRLVYIAGVGSGLLLLVGIVGTVAVACAKEAEPPLRKRSERIGMVVGMLFAGLAILHLESCRDVILEPLVSPILKIGYAFIVAVYSVAMVINLRYALLRWKRLQLRLN